MTTAERECRAAWFWAAQSHVEREELEREPGFYWVRSATDAYKGWMPAYFSPEGCWWLLGWDCRVWRDPEEIGERIRDSFRSS